jgi:hypothetical protein
MVSSDDEMRRTKIFPNNCMPYRLPRTCHAHSKGKKCKVAHAIGVLGHDSFVDTHTSIVIDIPRFCETDDGVDEDISLTLTGSADGKFTMGSVHWIASLEGHDFAPCKLLEV